MRVFVVGTATHINYNLLMGRFPGADGMKTGFICASGFNQVFLGDPQRQDSSQRCVRGAFARSQGRGIGAASERGADSFSTERRHAFTSFRPCALRRGARRGGRYLRRDLHQGSAGTRVMRAAMWRAKMVLDSPYLVALTRETAAGPGPRQGRRRQALRSRCRGIPLPIARPSETLAGQVRAFRRASAFTAPAGSAAAAEAMPLRSSVPHPHSTARKLTPEDSRNDARQPIEARPGRPPAASRCPILNRIPGSGQDNPAQPVDP